MLYASSEQASEALRAKCSSDSELRNLQAPSLETLGERAQRTTSLVLRALARAHRLLTPKSQRAGGVRFFVSHAKLDGLPLAASLRHVIGGYGFLRDFYDARDIEAGEDFREVLEDGVANSMLIALRTDIYDDRFWCRQEVMWAEQFDRPILL